MKIVRTDPFKKDFEKLPDDVKRRTEKSLKLLVEKPYHPFTLPCMSKKPRGGDERVQRYF